ncbi:transporter substrate-binding domain-containing protein [Parvularcula sp. LCG005]|uniref:substrate-binding periplasmic protein n=1 Tax=Parvularcula sp. LCG005 TaxID=3078805 RepID=UPI002943691C|nr:transporter substrate-binding domain-containing protein [Parvularcula sp. LCG005]WOI54224.1 transporter substrate-binding domain-containing protein [Parvularcula sp. LCG005]
MSIGNCAARILIILAMGFGTPAMAQDDNPLTVYTDVYRPYILPSGSPDGAAMEIVRLTLLNMERSPSFVYLDFNYGLYQTGKSDLAVSFPWRRTEEREKNFIFSAPLFTVESRFYYNARFAPAEVDVSELSDLRLGRTSGYSYGEQIDGILDEARTAGNVTEYASDDESIAALLKGEIDILPLPDTVVVATLDADFPDQQRLIRPVDGLVDRFALHLVAPRNDRGRDFIKAFNTSHRELIDAGVLTPHDAVTARFASDGVDIARVVTSEGFPIVVGEDRREPGSYYAIPAGTRVIVLEWSPRIRSVSNSDRLYAAMVERSSILVLNGPHVGKELLVKNIHIEISE